MSRSGKGFLKERAGRRRVFKDAQNLVRRRILKIKDSFEKKDSKKKHDILRNHSQPDIAGTQSLMQVVVGKTRSTGSKERACRTLCTMLSKHLEFTLKDHQYM